MLAKMLADPLPPPTIRITKASICRPFPRADARTRTGDPFITSEVLYQLSYVGGGSIVDAPRARTRLARQRRIGPDRAGLREVDPRRPLELLQRRGEILRQQ